MTIRGGGYPTTPLASMPLLRMGLPPRSFAVDAHGCIMVRILSGSTEYKVVARTRVQLASSPRIIREWRGDSTDAFASPPTRLPNYTRAICAPGVL
jgi:hypothetical protein